MIFKLVLEFVLVDLYQLVIVEYIFSKFRKAGDLTVFIICRAPNLGTEISRITRVNVRPPNEICIQIALKNIVH